MNDVMKRWIKALRSGEYKQGRGCLRTDNNEFCCLGVLCDVVNPNSWTLRADNRWTSDGKSAYPSESACWSAGISIVEAPALSGMNDSDELSFVAIANYLEEKYA